MNDRRVVSGVLAVWGVAVCAGAPVALGGSSPLFSDQTAAAGLTMNRPGDGSFVPQGMVAGGAAGDFDRDGDQDLFVLGGFSQPDRLYINNGDGTFTDQAVAWGVAATHRGVGVAVGDYDGDGYLDLYVTSDSEDGSTPIHNYLYHNVNGSSFVDVSAAAGVRTGPVQGSGDWGAAFGDYDLDGDLDLAVASWYGLTGMNRLYRNNGNGTFTDVTSSAFTFNFFGTRGFSPRFCDMNGDRYPELLWTSDFGTSRYFINNGNGTFTDATVASGTGKDGNGMGTTIGDFNNDGRPDWYVTSIYSPTPTANQPGTGNMLYMNQGNHVYAETSAIAGAKQCGWGWGTVSIDFDHDGDTDIVATNGFTPDEEFLNDPTRLFMNNGNATFIESAVANGVTHTAQGRGLLAFDYDLDGDQDFVIFTMDGPLTLYRNELVHTATTRWLTVALDTSASSTLAPDGYGAHVRATVNGVTRHRWLCGGSNFLSQSELTVHFGFGAGSVASELRVDWANGKSTTRTNVALDQHLTVVYCPADFNNANGVTVQDIFDFLTAWLAGNAEADFNNINGVTVQDIFDFLTAWLAGC